MVAARRSSTKVKLEPTPTVKEEKEDEDMKAVEAALADSPPARKKQKRTSTSADGAVAKTTKRKSTSTAVAKRGNAGKLEALNTIPTDVFLLIAGFLHPMDLLNIGRTNKYWRNFLMSSEAKPVWRAARGTVDELPDCPADLLEAQYAKLLFEHDCYRCGTRNVPKGDFTLRIRLCNPCARKEIFAKRRFKHSFPDANPDILDLVPYTNTGAFSHGHATASEFYYQPAVERMLRIAFEKQAELDDVEYAEWTEEQMAAVDAILKSGEEIEKWHRHDASEKSYDRSQLGEKRKAEIIARLEKLGHDQRDIVFDWSSDCQAIVTKPQELTERVWKNILPKLEASIKKKADSRIERETRDRARTRLSKLEGFYSQICNGLQLERPSRMDFFHLPCMISVWQPDAHRLIESADFPPVHVARQQAQQFVQQIKEGLQKRLVDAMAEDYPGRDELAIIRARAKDLVPASKVDDIVGTEASASVSAVSVDSCPSLALATSVFVCSQCLEPLYWPSLLRHSHIEGTYTYPYQTPASPSGPGPAGEWTKRWDPQMVSVSKAAILVMEGVVKAFGLSLTDATAFVTIQSKRQSIRCAECNHNSNWEHMFTHYLVQSRAESAKLLSQGHTDRLSANRHCPVGKDVLFIFKAQQAQQKQTSSQAGGSSARQVAALENLTPLQLRARKEKILSCRLCNNERVFMSSSIASHLKDKHKIMGDALQAPNILWPQE